MSFIDELKRRNVFRVGVAYVIVAWLLLQVADVVLNNIEAPTWVFQAILLVLVIGFPLALFFAWAFELTPEGIKKEKDVDRSESITHLTGRKLDFAIIGVLVVAVGFLLVDKLYLSNSDTVTDEIIATGRQSIAVLPFVNMSDDSDHFADGLSEELMNLLAKNPDLKVAGRTSSFAFKGQTPNFREIGDALSVDHVLEGSVRRAGDQLRVTAQLVKVEDGFHIWSDTYDRQMADIFKIQDDVAGAITAELKLRLVPPAGRPTENFDAYALYLEALAMLKRGAAGEAVDYLDRALRIDPRFAKAHELKAIAYWLGSGWRWDMPTAQRLIYESATAALKLDQALIGARMFTLSANPYEWSWAIELEAMEEAVAAAPGDTLLLRMMCIDLRMVGYREKALKCGQRLLELEPLWPPAHYAVGAGLSMLGRREEARDSWLKAADLGGPEYIGNIVVDYLVAGEYEAAIIAMEKTPESYGWDPKDARRMIEGAADPETGKAFLDAWMSDAVANAADFSEANLAYQWYLAFGHMDDYWRVIEDYRSQTDNSWSNSDNLEMIGVVYPSSGFFRHPKYISLGSKWGLTDLWEKRGPPDMCSKSSGQWKCE
jgi:TolB-like protein